jgi:REP-associated tyrosine transposase
MPSRLKRYQDTGQLHYITFTCYHRKKYLGTASARDLFEHTLERVQHWYGFDIVGYVVMPEHIHLLVGEPERATLASVLKMLKQITSRKLRRRAAHGAFWQKRYYDFNVFSSRKRGEKLRYMHFNPGPRRADFGLLGWEPVKRGLVLKPEDWKWSSYRHYLTGADGVVHRRQRKRERLGILPSLKRPT